MHCPSCGYCSQCGRSNHYIGQWPYQSPYWVSYTSSGVMGNQQTSGLQAAMQQSQQNVQMGGSNQCDHKGSGAK